MTDSSTTPHWTNLTQAYFPHVERESWYSAVAQTYARVRPSYPNSCIQQALAWGHLSSGNHILEIGCGPGIATLTLAELGFQITALEPSDAASQLAQARCQNFPQVKIINTPFETWQPEQTSYGAVLAATSFHWLDPNLRCPRIASLLKPQGPLILLWNVPSQPHLDVFKTMAPIYADLAPHLGDYETSAQHLAGLETLKTHILESGYFQEFQQAHQAWELTYSISDYLALLSTLSPYIALEPELRLTLFARLKASLHEAWGDTLTLNCLTVVQVTRKKS